MGRYDLCMHNGARPNRDDLPYNRRVILNSPAYVVMTHLLLVQRWQLSAKAGLISHSHLHIGH